jgi:tetratricopeptide (TPR) repeat protein
MLPGWQAVRVQADKVTLTAWDQSEIDGRCQQFATGNKVVAWQRTSYSRAQYLLAYLAIEDKDLREARARIDTALALDPDHPSILMESANVLRMEGGSADEILRVYRKASEQQYASQAQRAAAMRGEAVALIDLGRLDEAATRLNASLAIEDSQLARSELDYIARLRSGGDKAPVEIKAR